MATTVDQAVEIAAPADRVWQLVSTSEGLSGWFVDATVVGGPSGSVTLRFGPGAEGTMPIVAWEPPHRLRFGAGEGAPGRAHDIRVCGGPDGGCTVRVLDDGVETAEVDATSQGWASFLYLLKEQAEG